MIILEKLQWGNLFSYGEPNEVVFTENVVTQIIGANGNGKSSIPLILEEGLYNKNSKGIKKADIPNRCMGDGYWLKIYLSKDEMPYRIEIDRKTSIKVKLFQNAEDISSHTATNTFKQIEDMMGMDFKMFSQLVYQSTSASLQFLTATDTNRKKFLIDLLSLEEYVELFEIFKEAVKQHATIVSKIHGQVETAEKWLTQNSLQDLNEIPLVPTEELDTRDEEHEIAKISLEINNIDKTNKSINNNNHYKALLASINIEEVQAIEVEEPRSYDSEQAKLGGLNSQKGRIGTYVKKLESLGSTCPTCEQPSEESLRTKLIENEKRELNNVEEQIKEVSEIIEHIKSNNSSYKHKQERIRDWEELFASINRTLPAETINKQDLVDELTNLTLRVSNVREKIKAAIIENQAAIHHNSRIAVFKEQSEKFLADLDEYNEQLVQENKNLSNLELLKKAFSTNGLIAYKIENLVKDLEELTNDYLAELSDGRFTIEFSVASDKLNVNITDNGSTVDISALSSGELARVNTSTLLALRKLMASISKSRINVLFLDEVISVLDDQGKEKLVEVLLKENLNTYIVSHSWTHPLLAKLEVIKDDEVSRIEHG
jgi:DNA repair exonuclease SbcCD ATPase subunit